LYLHPQKRRGAKARGTGGERTAEGRGNKGLKMENQYEVGYSLITKEEHVFGRYTRVDMSLEARVMISERHLEVS
jgi:hypothetical protein